MKISSASKKVLASALSAAMVVAFAPTVAFGATAGEKIAVNYDMGQGVVTGTGNQAIQLSKTLTVASGGFITLDSGAANYKYGEYSFDHFVLDANKNGKVDTGENTTVGVSNSWQLGVSSFENGDEINLIAVYNKPAITANEASCVATVDSSGQLAFNVSSAGMVSAGTYTMALSKDGAVVASANLAGSAVPATLTAKFGQTAAKTSIADFAAGTVEFTTKLAAGTYTLSLTDTSKTTPVAVSSADIQVINVNATGNGGVFVKSGEYFAALDFMAVVGQTWSTALTNAGVSGYSIASADANHTASKNTNGNAFAGLFAGATAVSDSSLTGTGDVKAGQTSLVAKYETGISSVTYSSRIITANIDSSATADSTKDYFVAFTSPTGVELSKTQLSGTSATCNFGVVDPALGEYTVTLTSKVKAGNANAGAVAVVDTAKITLVKVAYDKGEGQLKTGSAAPASQIMASTDKIAKSTTEAKGSVFEGKNGETFDKWTVGGAAVAYDSTDNFTVGTGDSYVVTLTASYKVTKATKPTAAYADGILTLSQTMGSDYEIYFNAGTGAKKYTGSGIVVAKAGTDSVTAWVQPKADATGTLKASDTVTFDGFAKAGADRVTDFEAKADNLLNVLTADSTDAAPQYYRSVLSTVKADGTAAIKAIGYATAADWNATVTAQQKAVLEAIVAHETAQLEAKAALAKSSDGKTYSYVTEAERQAAIEKMAKVVADFDVNHDKDTTNNVVKNGDVTYADTASTANSYSAAVRAAAKSAKAVTVAAADAEASIAVSTQLKAAKTEAEAKAAIEAYNKLTDAQKALVSSADIAAAQEIVAAAEVKDAQDDAAVSKARSASKTVKAGKNGKTTKTQSITLKKITSKSGAKVTYKKITKGSSKYITVKSGKAYLKKGVKKGSYKAYVSAKCGTQTAKIKVTFKVK